MKKKAFSTMELIMSFVIGGVVLGILIVFFFGMEKILLKKLNK